MRTAICALEAGLKQGQVDPIFEAIELLREVAYPPQANGRKKKGK
jgi:hypothetical protein